MALPQPPDLLRDALPVRLVEDARARAAYTAEISINPVLCFARFGKEFLSENTHRHRTHARLRPAPLAAQAAKGKGKKVAPDYANTIATLQTDLGDIQIKFFYDKAPKHVENFMDLSRSRASTTARSSTA